MKNRLIALLALIPGMAMAQAKHFTITGKIGDLNAPATVYFGYENNGVIKYDSSVLVNGMFKLTGTTADYSSVVMGLDHTGGGVGPTFHEGDVIYFYIGNENIRVNSPDSMQKATITGSKVNEEYNAFKKYIGGSIMDLTKVVRAEFASTTPEQQRDTVFMKSIEARHRQRIADWAKKQFEFAKAYPNSYFSLDALSSAQMGVSLQDIEPVYNKLNPALKNTDKGKELAQRINAAHVIGIGRPAPTFTQNDLNGKPVSLTGMRGKYVLVEFWASWCGPCRAENPNLLKQYTKYNPKGFEILGISLDSQKDFWTKAVATDGMPWTQLSDLQGWNNAVCRLYGVRGVPASYLIDPKGNLIGINLRGEELNKKLAELFN